MTWFGSGRTTFEFRRAFARDYLAAAGFPAGDDAVHAFLLDAEVNTGGGAVSLRVHRCQKYLSGGLLPLVCPSRSINPSKGVL